MDLPEPDEHTAAAYLSQMSLQRLQTEIGAELSSLLHYWQTRCMDEEHGGFCGRIDNNNAVDRKAEKGAVLHARILWSFSAAAQACPDQPAYATTAKKAWEYIRHHFMDMEQGGVFWTVSFDGKPAQTRKQVYAQAFAIYAFAEYYRLSGDAGAKEQAINLYRLLKKWSHDDVCGGYLEAFTSDWKLAADLRLSAKDANEKKTMNTHLHVLEGYANLYSVWPEPALKESIRELLQLFDLKIIDSTTGHLNLFFTEEWELKGHEVSYGHDIEAAWLLLEAAETIGDKGLIKDCRRQCITLAEAAAEGLDADGGMWYELHADSGRLVREKHWWVQAEAMVGFLSAWQIGGQQKYLDAVFANWQFVKDHIIDRSGGEWFWGVKEDYSIMNEDKAGLWKCPYHNSRACIELIKRIDASQ